MRAFILKLTKDHQAKKNLPMSFMAGTQLALSHPKLEKWIQFDARAASRRARPLKELLFLLMQRVRQIESETASF